MLYSPPPKTESCFCQPYGLWWCFIHAGCSKSWGLMHHSMIMLDGPPCPTADLDVGKVLFVRLFLDYLLLTCRHLSNKKKYGKLFFMGSQMSTVNQGNNFYCKYVAPAWTHLQNWLNLQNLESLKAFNMILNDLESAWPVLEQYIVLCVSVSEIVLHVSWAGHCWKRDFLISVSLFSWLNKRWKSGTRINSGLDRLRDT